MYKIMLVDDEPIVRLAIKSLINWEEHGFEIAFEASNGKQALKLLETNPGIDIIITDINMPILDGLELITQITDMNLEPEIIVLSSYNDYDWVRKAFKLGVNDYILKTEMEPLSILELVKGMAEKIDNKKRSLQNTNNVNNFINSRYRKENILQELLTGGDTSILALNEPDGMLKINKNKIALCYLWVDDYQTVKEKYISNSLKAFTQSVVNSIDQVLTDTNSGEVLCISPEEYLIFMGFDELSQKQIRYKITDVIGRIQYSLKTYVNITASVGISEVGSIKEELEALSEQAKQNVKLRFILGKGKIIFPETANMVMWKNREYAENSDQKKETIIGREEAFLNALGDADEDRASAELEKLFDIIRNNGYNNKIEKIYSSYMELLFVTASYLSKIGKETQQIFGTEIDFYEKILRFETQEEINVWIRNMVSWIINYLKEGRSSKQNRVIQNAKQFIQMNYSDASLSLKTVSEYVELSESHFSTTFTKDVGETFTDYLTNTRLEKAKELIATTNLKLYEISERVGYTNAEHFSRIFKKNVGCSPKDYMKKL
jgi:YesN/AraC family two-component response regulator